MKEQSKIDFLNLWKNTKVETEDDLNKILLEMEQYPTFMGEEFHLICNNYIRSGEQIKTLLNWYKKHNISLTFQSLDDFYYLAFGVNQLEKTFSKNIHELMQMTSKIKNVKNEDYLNSLWYYLLYIVKDGSFLFDFVFQLLIDCKRMTKENNHEFTIEYNSSGHNKSCFNVGDYVLTIGYPKDIEKIIYSEQFMPPLIEYFHKESKLQIAVRPKGDLNSITEEDLRTCYMYECSKGRLYLDCRFGNVAKYKEDFVHPFKNTSIEGKKNLGIESYDLRNRKQGEITIIDCDYVVDMSTCDYETHYRFYRYNHTYQKFYDEYIEEKQKQKIKK